MSARSPSRALFAILMKEFIQMRRDRMTFALMIGVPVMQLLLFGFAINTDPRHLPTAVHIADDSVYARSIGAALKNSDYFDIVAIARTPQEAERMLDEGEVAFAITVPVNFARDLVRGQIAAIADPGGRERSRGILERARDHLGARDSPR